MMSTPKGLSPTSSLIHLRSMSSWSGVALEAPRMPMPPALDTAATTSRQWVKARMGNSIPRSSQTRLFTAVPLSRPPVGGTCCPSHGRRGGPTAPAGRAAGARMASRSAGGGAMSEQRQEPTAKEEREQRFERRMTDAEALMWNVEKDPWLNPNGGVIAVCDGVIDDVDFERGVAVAGFWGTPPRGRGVSTFCPWAPPGGRPAPRCDPS